MNEQTYVIRPPMAHEFPLVRQLRHEALDPARVHQVGTEPDESDAKPTAIHMAAFLGEQIVHTLRVDLDPKDSREYEVVAVATDEAHQGKGLASRSLLAVEKIAIERGARMLKLSARLEKVAFYEKLGYHTVSDVFVSSYGVENRWMEKRVSDGK